MLSNFENFSAWQEFLQSKPWTSFATFTTRKPITLKSARRLMEKVGARLLGKDEQLFWAAERFNLGCREGSYHVHALINTRHSANDIENWYSEKYGRAQVMRYDPTRGASMYCSKYLTKTVSDYDLLTGRGEPELFDIGGKSRGKR